MLLIICIYKFGRQKISLQYKDLTIQYKDLTISKNEHLLTIISFLVNLYLLLFFLLLFLLLLCKIASHIDCNYFFPCHSFFLIYGVLCNLDFDINQNC